MAQEKDKVVGQIFETYDYEKFIVLSENRGQKDNKGLKRRKLVILQRKIERGEWMPALSRVKVNKSFQVIDGAHTLEICRLNEYPVRYEITNDDHFNDVTKREIIGNVYILNSTNTAWTQQEFLNAAVQTKAPLAIIVAQLVEDNDNYFSWLDVMALLQKDSNLFSGRWRDKMNMQVMEDKGLIERFQSPEFTAEVQSFIKMNNKVRVSHRRQLVMKNIYDILWGAHDMIKPLKFRAACASLPDTLLMSDRVRDDDSVRRMLLQNYNKTQGQEVEISTILYALKHKTDEPVLEI